MSSAPQHPRAFTVSVVWTLLLLYLGSVVHATESSLACPDWPTCFGTMVPEMSGGVFWEHLHRLVAGGLLLMWGLATWFAHRETRDRPWIVKASWVGVGLLLVQSVFGGLTVIFLLPDLVSTTHLTLAFAFLALAAFLASATGWSRGVAMSRRDADEALGLGVIGAGLVFAQSVLGALVRHTDSGMACPDAPLCLGELVPPLDNHLITLHFLHRAVGLIAALVVVGIAVWAGRGRPRAVRSTASWAAMLVVFQVILGFVSVLTGLAVVPVSFHTLVAAVILVLLVHLAGMGWSATDQPAAAEAPSGAALA